MTILFAVPSECKHFNPSLILNLLGRHLLFQQLLQQNTNGLAFLYIDNSHIFLQHLAAIFMHLVGLFVEMHFSGNLWPTFNLIAYLQCTELFRKKLDGSRVFSLLLGNNRKHMPVHAQMISSWVRKVLRIAKVHVSGYSVDVAVSVALTGD